MTNFTKASLLLMATILAAACGDQGGQTQAEKSEALYFQISGAT